MEQYFQQQVAQSNCSGDHLIKCKSSSNESTGMANNSNNNNNNNNSSNGFDCNICLDLVQDPVVTLCGHLYCWPCIYKWMSSQSSSFENSDQQPQCPVCKAEVSQRTLIPLYGRGQARKSSTKLDVVIPQRPNGPGCGVHTLITAMTSRSPHHPRQDQQQLHYQGYHPHHHQVYPYYSLDDYSHPPTFGLAGTTTYNPTIGMFGEMIYARIFGNSQTTLFSYPNTYSVATASSARVRRHAMQVDRSLSRVSFFLCCCILLCLLLF